ncbi:hypothetical protein [Nostoc sp. NMS8]|uniref:hypothetical protein n=1 Tax=Nostoc sp. NMS8 TaxID=2815392 RepID=UPI0025FD1F6B|nr:hypothetical protein [Nostoc sp. NMS8]MBN3957353.1 hypothetical protein [Nostoc sp. NMS8]
MQCTRWLACSVGAEGMLRQRDVLTEPYYPHSLRLLPWSEMGAIIWHIAAPKMF